MYTYNIILYKASGGSGVGTRCLLRRADIRVIVDVYTRIVQYNIISMRTYSTRRYKTSPSIGGDVVRENRCFSRDRAR